MNRLLFLAAAALVPAAAGAQTAPAQSAGTVVPAPATRLPLKHAAEPTTADITARDLMTRLYIFADDSMQGREAGKLGNFKGTEYLAREVKRMGLQPAGDSGTYFQTLPFKSRTVDSASTLIASGAPLDYAKEWAIVGTHGGSVKGAGVVFGGFITDSVSLPESQAAGKIVVFAPGPQTRGLRLAPQMAPGAAAIAIVVPDQFMGFLSRPSQFLDDGSAAADEKAPVAIAITRAGATRLFDTPLAQLTPGAAGKEASFDVRVNIAPVPYPARNVVALLPGSDPKLAGEYVAIGAHNDHVGFNDRPVDHDSIRIFNHIVRPGGAEDMRKSATPEQQAEVNKLLAEWRETHPGTLRADSIDNGADDDGSGSVGVLEIAEKMAAMKTKPKRSTLFVWHVGEEKGLLGSEWFTDHPTVPRDSIVAQLNMDMIGRGDAWDETGKTKEGAPLHGSENYVQLVGSRRLSKELGDLIEQVNTEGKHGLTLDYAMDANGHPMNIYCRSDHYEYARYGIPITFFTTGGHSDYHQVTDEPQYIDYDHMARVASLVEDVAVRVGNLDHRIVVDQPKPDPKGRCQQ